jgi:hypothetical protein
MLVQCERLEHGPNALATTRGSDSATASRALRIGGPQPRRHKDGRGRPPPGLLGVENGLLALRAGPVTTSEFRPELERFVCYDAGSICARSHRGRRRACLGAVSDARGRAIASAREAGSTIVALLEGRPLAGRRVARRWSKVARRKTIEVDADDGGRCRYCLAEWAEVGRSAVHTFCASSSDPLCAESVRQGQ